MSGVGTTQTDRWGVPINGTEPEAIARLDQAILELVRLQGDPAASAQEAAELDPDLELAVAFRADLELYATNLGGMITARELLDRGERDRAERGAPPLTGRAACHWQAARAWSEGDLQGAIRAWEDALLLHPRDLLALKLAQDVYFFLGDRRNLRDVAARVLDAWSPDDDGWGYVQGIYAFGLEENAAYRDAERAVGAALAADPGDVWAVHAGAHVFEMEGRQAGGLDFLEQTRPDWESSYFAVHNFWHAGLFHLERLDVDAALALYDGSIAGSGSTIWLDLVDAAALLWRLRLYGVDVAERAAALADLVAPLTGDHVYVFNDWHAVMAYGLAGRHQEAAALVAGNRDWAAAAPAPASNRRVIEDAGASIMAGFVAFALGDHRQAAELLYQARPHAHLVGGSHAQRDVIDLTLLAAAAASGQAALTRALLSERLAWKPTAAAAAERIVERAGG